MIKADADHLLKKQVWSALAFLYFASRYNQDVVSREGILTGIQLRTCMSMDTVRQMREKEGNFYAGNHNLGHGAAFGGGVAHRCHRWQTTYQNFAPGQATDTYADRARRCGGDDYRQPAVSG